MRGPRTLLRAAVVTATSAALGGFGLLTGDFPAMSPLPPQGAGSANARLAARLPPVPVPAAAATPSSLLALPGGPEVLVRVPATAGAAPLRLVLALHGAGGNAKGGLAPLLPLADAHGLLLLAPTSHAATWDAVTAGWGPDVRRIDDALARVFGSYPVDPTRLAVSGFSDGASYALSLGLANADLFTHVMAFSPGFIAPGPRAGSPRVFLCHGRHDTVLPIDRTTRRIVPQLRSARVPTEVREFDGAHTVPASIAEDAVRWLMHAP
ncbi:alpha/beta hydrolase [Pseudonocardia xinjiangensis]|uniref:alpha/beta hydrolase n=1 Tax=Pseudonocardia xinjiangensis TaxID=75289 RepID=UPI003D8C236C